MNWPDRLQRKRTKGFRLPPRTVCVSRGSRYGNPFRPYAVTEIIGLDVGIHSVGVIRVDSGSVEECLAWYRIWAMAQLRLYANQALDWLAPLRGAEHIACWCPLYCPCHADELIDLLKRPPMVRSEAGT